MDLTDLNDSELAALARQFTHEAHRDLPRDTLTRIITEEDVQLKQRPINKRRLQVMNYLNKHWEQVSYQISCPAKTRSAWACFQCCDLQSADCILSNPAITKTENT